ncbi:hypothetical protein IAR55_002875 [Kwoniella newhampshirensis]|uniref:U2A'/phosphoprotein 32 family A C-terminal domain-containing protein n=1 Tax=Kwoniella newhampshirensis TaxID=1651941 RepID=A0AAW0YSV7_9TREE
MARISPIPSPTIEDTTIDRLQSRRRMTTQQDYRDQLHNGFGGRPQASAQSQGRATVSNNQAHHQYTQAPGIQGSSHLHSSCNQASPARRGVKVTDYGFPQGRSGQPQAFTTATFQSQQVSNGSTQMRQPATISAIGSGLSQTSPGKGSDTSARRQMPTSQAIRAAYIDPFVAQAVPGRELKQPPASPAPQAIYGQRSRPNDVSSTPSSFEQNKDQIRKKEKYHSSGAMRAVGCFRDPDLDDEVASNMPPTSKQQKTTSRSGWGTDTNRVMPTKEETHGLDGRAVITQAHSQGLHEFAFGPASQPFVDQAFSGSLSSHLDLIKANEHEVEKSSHAPVYDTDSGPTPQSVVMNVSLEQQPHTSAGDDDSALPVLSFESDEWNPDKKINDLTMKTPGKRKMEDFGDEENSSVFNFTPTAKQGTKQKVTALKPRFVVPKGFLDHTSLLRDVKREEIFFERMRLAREFKHNGVFQETTRLFQEQQNRLAAVVDQFDGFHGRINALIKKKDAELQRKVKLTERYAEAGSELSGQCVDLQAATRNGNKHKVKRSRGAMVNGTTSSKPRARLGPMEIVQLPASDSEPEDEAEDGQTNVGEEKGEGDLNFLKEYPEDTEELHLQHLRLKTTSLQPLDLGRFSKYLKRLCLRQNELTSPLPSEGFAGLEELEDLDMYDNRLGTRVTDEELKGCPNLTSLDLSFNNIRHLPNLPSLTKVKTFYLIQNKISTIEEGELDWCKDTITSLELGGNRIRVIENLEKLTLLEELWLGKNKIRKLENLNTFSSLKILSLQSNRITKMEGFEALVNLEELYLSHNGLTKIEGLEKNVKLKTLDIGNNMIEEIEGVSHLVDLEEFWASYNKIANLRALDTQLRPLENLETVYLEGNPCQKDDMANYRRKVMLALPQISQIDAT